MNGYFRMTFAAVFIAGALVAVAVPPAAEAKMAQAGNCLGCHNEKNSTAQVTFSLDGSTVALTATPAQTWNHEGTITVSPGQVFEVDFIAAGMVRNNSDNIAVVFPASSTWVAGGGTVPPAGSGTGLATDLATWSTWWDQNAAGMIGWNEPVRATRGSEPVGIDGDLYTKNWAGNPVGWDEGPADTAQDDGTEPDAMANRMGGDVVLTAPTVNGNYDIYLVGVGSGSAGGKGYVATRMIVSVSGGDVIPPTVTSSTPAKNEPSAPLNGAVTINFSEPIDCTTVNTTNVTMTTGGWSLGSCGGSTAVFNTSGQTGSTFYTVTVTTAVKDLAGNPLDPSNTLNVIGYITNAAATPPDTFITAPAAAAVLSGATFNITGTATPGTNPVAGVQLSTDNGGIWNAATGTESWSYLWTLPAEDYVSHTLLAKAVDNTALEDLTPRSVSITVDTVAPAGLANSAPVNGGTGVSTGSSLLAVAATDGNPTVEYLFELAGDAAFTVAPQASSWQAGSSWAPVLAGGATYYWRVSVRDGAGNLAGPTATWTFQTAAGCSRLDPTVTILTASKDITVDGGFVDHTVQVVNNDSVTCGNTTFNLSVSDSNGTNFYPSTLAQSALVVVPGGSSQTTFRVTAKANQPNSVTDNSDVTSVADGNHGAVTSTSVTTTINVSGGGCVAAGSYLNGNGDQLSTSR